MQVTFEFSSVDVYICGGNAHLKVVCQPPLKDKRRRCLYYSHPLKELRAKSI